MRVYGLDHGMEFSCEKMVLNSSFLRTRRPLTLALSPETGARGQDHQRASDLPILNPSCNAREKTYNARAICQF